MKRTVALLLAMTMALCCAACGGPGEPAPQPETANTPLPMRSATPAPEEAETPEPEPVSQPVSTPGGTTAVGNLLIHYPEGIEYAWDFASTTISFTPFEDKSAFVQFSARSRKSAGWSFDEMIENSGMQEIIDGMKAELGTTEALDEGPVDMLGVTGYYFYHEHMASGSAGYSKHYMFSDDEYNYQIFTFTSDALRAEYESSIDEVVAGVNWGQLDHKIYADNYVTFHYPLRYLEWSTSSAAGTDVLYELMELVPENGPADWTSTLELFLLALYDTEGANAAFVPRIHMRLLDIPDATEETLHDPEVLQGIADQLSSEHPTAILHREVVLERHGELEFAVAILETTEGVPMVLYQASHVWDERMLVTVLATPVELFGDEVVAEMEALLASLRVMHY